MSLIYQYIYDTFIFMLFSHSHNTSSQLKFHIVLLRYRQISGCQKIEVVYWAGLNLVQQCSRLMTDEI